MVHSVTALRTSAGRRVENARAVAQIFNLPYRRIAFGGASNVLYALASRSAWQSPTLRYSRVQLCATRLRASLWFPNHAPAPSHQLADLFPHAQRRGARGERCFVRNREG